MEQTHALGRRKAAVARVYLTPGAGNVTVNGRALETYFALDSLRYIVNQPFEVTSTLGQFDVKVNKRLLQPVIDGNEIMQLFHLQPSREVGVLKQYLKDAVLDNKVENEREPLMLLLMQKAREMGLSDQ